MKTLPAVFLVFLASGAFAAEPTTYDFAAGYSLELEGNGPIYTLRLPAEVYRTVRRADLGDIRVFNGGGEIVPHSLRAVEADPQTLGEKSAMPFFPIPAGGAGNQLSDLALRVTRNQAGTIVDIKYPPVAGGTARRAAGYILDLSGEEKGIRELEFFWREGPESSMFSITLHESDDLVRWQPLVSRATLAELEYAGQKVERRNVPLPHQPKQYLKISWEGALQPLELTSVNGYSHILSLRQEREWIDFGAGTVQSEDNRTIIGYHGDYRLPATGAQLHFPGMNAVARLSVQSRPDDKTNWSTRCEQVFYTLALDNALLRNEPCTFPLTTDRQWRLVVHEDGAGLRSGKDIPSLQLGVRPRELVFLGRGTPPFLLAFGSGRLALADQAGDGGMIVQTLEKEGDRRMTGVARLGKQHTLGGEEALQPPIAARPWKKWLLWAVLVLGVGILAVMARHLLGEMKKEDANREQ